MVGGLEPVLKSRTQALVSQTHVLVILPLQPREGAEPAERRRSLGRKGGACGSRAALAFFSAQPSTGPPLSLPPRPVQDLATLEEGRNWK